MFRHKTLNPHSEREYEHVSNCQSEVAIVLGMHRSGTSVFAGALSSLGVDLGDRLIDGDKGNPKGYFENQEVVEINESALSTLGCSWYSILVPDCTNLVKEAVAEQAQKFIVSQLSKNKSWGFKDPRVTRLLPLWRSLLDGNGVEGKYILANRHPLSVAQSLSKRDNLPLAHSLGLWLMHQVAGLREIIDRGGIVVDYDMMLAEPTHEINRIAEFLNINQASDKVREYETEFLDTSLRHARFVTEDILNCCGVLGRICGELYECLIALSNTTGCLTLGNLAAGKVVVSKVDAFVEENEYWFSALDQDSRNFNKESKPTIRALEHQINRLDSQLRWLEQRPPYRIMRLILSPFHWVFDKNRGNSPPPNGS